MLFIAQLGNSKFDEALSYHTKQFKVHVAVKEITNIRDEMDSIITQKYKKNQEIPDKKNRLNRNVEKIRNKKEQIHSAITLMN